MCVFSRRNHTHSSTHSGAVVLYLSKCPEPTSDSVRYDEANLFGGDLTCAMLPSTLPKNICMPVRRRPSDAPRSRTQHRIARRTSPNAEMKRGVFERTPEAPASMSKCRYTSAAIQPASQVLINPLRLAKHAAVMVARLDSSHLFGGVARRRRSCVALRTTKRTGLRARWPLALLRNISEITRPAAAARLPLAQTWPASQPAHPV